MAKLTAKRRNALPKTKARASQQIAQVLSPAEKSRIVAKANRMLAGKG